MLAIRIKKALNNKLLKPIEKKPLIPITIDRYISVNVNIPIPKNIAPLGFLMAMNSEVNSAEKIVETESFNCHEVGAPYL